MAEWSKAKAPDSNENLSDNVRFMNVNSGPQ